MGMTCAAVAACRRSTRPSSSEVSLPATHVPSRSTSPAYPLSSTLRFAMSGSSSFFQPGSFDAWLQSPASSDVIDDPVRLLLDVPPHEVRVLIAQFVSRGVQNEHLLALARTNATQQSAVIAALNHRLEIPLFSITRSHARWVDVFACDVKEVVCNSRHRTHVRSDDPHLVDLCRAPTLRKVTLWDHEMLLDAIRGSPYIREVTASMTSHSQFLPLLHTLKSLTLTSLELICKADGHTCYFSDFNDLPEGQRTISAWCPSLRVLHMHCARRNNRSTNDVHGKSTNFGDPTMHSLPGLRRLEAITLYVKPTAEALLLINGLREVKLQDEHCMAYDKECLRGLAPFLTALSTTDSFSDRRGAELRECIELKELETTLDVGNEVALAQVLRRMPQLRQLTLRWTLLLEDLPAEMGPRKRPTFVRPENLVGLIVDNVPILEKLHLLDVEISQEDLASILSGVGAGLKELEVELVGQNENPAARLVILLGLVMVHCPKLQRLTFFSSERDLHDHLAKGDVREIRKEMEALVIAAELLMQLHGRHMPMFDVRDVARVWTTVKRFFTIRRRDLLCRQRRTASAHAGLDLFELA